MEYRINILFHQHWICISAQLKILDQFKGAPRGHVCPVVNINSQLMAFTMTFLPLCFFSSQMALMFSVMPGVLWSLPIRTLPLSLFPPFVSLHAIFSRYGHTHPTVRQSMELQRVAVIMLVNVLCCVTACPQD